MQDAEPVTAEDNDYSEEKIAGRFPPGSAAQGPGRQGQAKPAGEPSIDAMIARLDGLDDRPLEEHVAVFEETHAGLRQVLSELDSAPGAGAGPGSAGPPGPGRR